MPLIIVFKWKDHTNYILEITFKIKLEVKKADCCYSIIRPTSTNNDSNYTNNVKSAQIVIMFLKSKLKTVINYI